MEISRLDPQDTAAVEELFAHHRDVQSADAPESPASLRGEFIESIRLTSPEMRVERYNARLDGKLVGAAALRLPQVDNRHLGQLEVEVSPEFRRRGIGSALLDLVCRRTREEQRGKLISWTMQGVPGGPPRDGAGARFLAARGFTLALQGMMRRIDLPAIDEAAEQALLDECLAHAGEYEIIGWTGLTPDELAGGTAYLFNRLNTDAPTGEADIQATTMDAERLHADERLALARHSQLVGVAARHVPTGEVAALTMINVRSAGDQGWVTVTIADPKHRGHRLGTIVKIEIHRLVRRSFPAARYVRTGNADANAHMVAINERLGYVAYEAGSLYQLTL